MALGIGNRGQKSRTRNQTNFVQNKLVERKNKFGFVSFPLAFKHNFILKSQRKTHTVVFDNGSCLDKVFFFCSIMT